MAVNRLTGLVSGMDYETMINDLMKVERAPLDKLKQQKQVFQWQQDIFRDINTSILALRTEAFNMKLSSSYRSFTTSISDTTAVSATATASAVEGTYRITIDRLATTAQRQSYDGVDPENALVSSYLQSSSTDPIDFSSALDLRGKDFKLTYNGVQKTISWSDTDPTYANIGELAAGLQQKINNAFGANQIEVTENGSQIILKPKDATFKPNIVVNTGTNDALAQLKFTNGQQYHISLDTKLSDIQFRSGGLTLEAGKVDFTINGKRFQIDSNRTLADLISTVNADETADVTMSYDTTLDKFIIKRDTPGAGVSLDVQDNGASNFLSRIKVTDPAAYTPGQNAQIDFTDPSGVTMTNLEMSSNTFTLQGLTVTLQKADGVEKTITIGKDVNAVFDKIKSFIDKYNETIEKINVKLSEKREYKFTPLTDEQKKEMEEKDIELWEEKAKSGLVGGDTVLQGIVRDLRYSMNNEVVGLNANLNQLREFGITTGSYKENGKLHIDESKLKKAIAENPDEVLKFFSFNPPDLKGEALSGVVDVEGKNFNLTVNGITQTVTLSGSYDLATSEGKANFLKEINKKITEEFGYNQVVASMTSDNRLILSSPSGNSFTLNSGASNDVLATLGFTDGTTYDATRKGIVAKVYDKLTIGMRKLTEKAGAAGFEGYFDSSLIGERIKRIDKRIDEYSDRLIQIEDRYYRQFTAMETALSRMNAQSAWLSQQSSG